MLEHISFLSFYIYACFDYNFVANRWKSGVWPNTEVVLQKWPTWFVTTKLLILDLLSMSPYLYTYTHVYILHIIYNSYMYIVCVSLLLLCSSISLKMFNLFTLFFHRCVWYYLGNHLFKNASQPKDLCWSHFGLFLGSFWWCYTIYWEPLNTSPWRFVKIFLNYFKMLTALKETFRANPPFLEAILGCSFGRSCGIFLYFLRKMHCITYSW